VILNKYVDVNYTEINKRYSDLAETTCCFSCGGAINHSEAKSNEVCVDLGSGRGTDAIRLAEIFGSGGYVYGIELIQGLIFSNKPINLVS
jgi:arsenite methyltransferase